MAITRRSQRKVQNPSPLQAITGIAVSDLDEALDLLIH
jgi:hypothetical protein